MIIALDTAYRAAAEGRFPGHDLRFFPSDLTSASEFATYLAEAQALVTRRVFPFPFDPALLA